jgi:hypothetical protein
VSLFDPAVAPDEAFTPELIAGVNGVIDRLNALKVESLSVAGSARTSNLVRCYIQAHIRRCLTFVEGGHAAFCAGRSLVADACARANYENVAAFCDFANALVPLLDTGDHVAIREFVEARAFATRIPSLLEQHGESIRAKQILNQIDRMKAKYPSFREAYDHLSDSTHPNTFGAVVHFVSIDHSTSVATFAESGNNPHWSLTSLITSGFMLAFVEISIDDIERNLAKLDSG